MPDYVGRSISDKVRVHAPDPWTLQVFLRERGDQDDLPCKCCAFECEAELTIEVTFCGMTAIRTVPIPGFLDGNQIETLPDDSYLIVSGQISCTNCGWFVAILICGYCVATEQYASDGFTGFIPFAATAEASGGYCPEAGAVDLTCFGEQFGIPCVTTTTAEIA